MENTNSIKAQPTDESCQNFSVENTAMEEYTDESCQNFSVENTAMEEYYDIVKSEYETERNKKQSFENRAGLIMTFLGAILVFMFDKVSLIEVYPLLTETPLSFLMLLKILSILGIHSSFIFTITMLVRTLSTNLHENFDVEKIDEDLLGQPRDYALCQIIFTYRDIITQHRNLNESRAKHYKNALYGIVIILISLIIYINLN